MNRKSIAILFSGLILLPLLSALHAAEAGDPPPPPQQAPPAGPGLCPPPPPPVHHSPEHFRRGPGIWRAFSLLSDEEKKELLELQRKSPDQFRAVMQEKADHLYEKERAKRAQMEEIARQYKKAADEAEKRELRARLREIVRQDFTTHMNDARRNLEESKRRIRRLEEDLANREANADAIIDAITEKHLTK